MNTAIYKIEEFVQGEWIKHSNPTDIERVLQESNIQKYNSTNNTPLMKSPWKERLGYLGETKKAKAIVEGKYVFPKDSDSYVRRMLECRKHADNIETLFQMRNRKEKPLLNHSLQRMQKYSIKRKK